MRDAGRGHAICTMRKEHVPYLYLPTARVQGSSPRSISFFLDDVRSRQRLLPCPAPSLAEARGRVHNRRQKKKKGTKPGCPAEAVDGKARLSPRGLPEGSTARTAVLDGESCVLWWAERARLERVPRAGAALSPFTVSPNRAAEGRIRADMGGGLHGREATWALRARCGAFRFQNG